MEIKTPELKQRIEDKRMKDFFLVLLYSDNDFLAKHYVKEIAKNKSLVYIDALNKIPTGDLFEEELDSIYVFNTDKFESSTLKYKNVIVICKSVEEKTKELLSSEGLYVELPKLQDWQLLEYSKFLCGGLKEEQLEWLYKITKGDVYRFINEVTKISIFNPAEQSSVFEEINRDGGYSDLSSSSIYDLTNAITGKRKKALSLILTELQSIDVEGIGVITVLYRNIKILIHLQINPSITSKELGISDRQRNAISYNINKFTDTQLIDVLEFLTSLDYKIKSGNLQVSNESLINLIVCKILSI